MTSPSPIFYKLTETGTQRHTGEYMAKVMIEVLEAIEVTGPSKYGGIVTDNASNMKHVCNIIHKEYPHTSCYGCSEHGLHTDE